jgi:hypothetical protein
VQEARYCSPPVPWWPVLFFKVLWYVIQRECHVPAEVMSPGLDCSSGLLFILDRHREA